MMVSNKIFYTLKPILPRAFQVALRRRIVLQRRKKFSAVWPIDEAAGQTPAGWPGWPDGKQFALVLAHDVDTQRGHDNVMRLAEVEMSLGFRSCFNFVPERYNLSRKLIDEVKALGFEVGVHGLKHDGKLFWSKEIFAQRAVRINAYIKDWGASGFTSPSMHHNLSWMNLLDIQYATSTFDTDPFEPQPDGCGTIFPFWVPNGVKGEGYVELPYTLPQDFTLFVLMREKDNRIWKQKLDWIASKGGMVLLNTHPDYMQFNGQKMEHEMYSIELFEGFLEYIKQKYQGRYWQALPREIAEVLQ